jgi:crotonobetaine/carnitine-CoA ligase
MRVVLQNLSLSKGDAVLIMLDNCGEFVDLFGACGASGVMQVPVNTEYRGNLLRHAIEASGAPVMIIDSAYADRLADVQPFTRLDRLVVLGSGPAPALDGVEVSALSDLQAAATGDAGELPPMQESEPLAIMYTSGTTGPSKAVLIAHRHAYEYANAAAKSEELTGGDVYYAPLPLFHIAGQWAILYASWIVGATAIVKRRFSANEFWSDIRTHGVTVTFLLGAMAQFLFAMPEEDDDADNPLDRVLMVPLVADLDGFRKRFDVRVTTCYGSTDVNVPIMSDYAVTDTTVAGHPLPGFQVRLVDENDEDVADGVVGELVVRPPEPWMTMVEYIGDPEATAYAFRNMWLHSGDMMRRDETGQYHFVDRLKDAIRRRGENISSFEVESEVNAHPAIAESAAIAVPSAHTEDDLGLVVTLRESTSATEAELREFMTERAPKFMVPDHIWIVDEMPKTPTGKIQKHLLRKQFGSERDPLAGLRKQATDTG